MADNLDNSQPIVLSVIMCVYNGEAFLKEAIESVLTQTFSAFEFIIVNDGSTDATGTILSSFDDQRIKIIDNDTNLGLINSLNLGLQEARGEFVARMDADDICVPHRFEKQLAFLDKNPDVGVCGSWLRIVDEDAMYKFPLDHDGIKAGLLERNSLAHPSVLFRSSLLKKAGLAYDLGYPGAEDYELWSRMIFVTRFANIPEPLLLYRRHLQQVTQKKQEMVEDSSGRIKLALLRFIGIQPDERQAKLHLFLFNNQSKELRQTDIVADADAWMYKIVLANRTSHQFGERYLLDLWRSKLLITCVERYDLTVWSTLKRSKCFELTGVTIRERAKIFIKCLLRKRVG